MRGDGGRGSFLESGSFSVGLRKFSQEGCRRGERAAVGTEEKLARSCWWNFLVIAPVQFFKFKFNEN